MLDLAKLEKHPGLKETYLESSRDHDKYTNVNDTEHRRCGICPKCIFSCATEIIATVSFCTSMKKFTRSKYRKRKSHVSAIIKFLKKMFVGRISQLTIDYMNTKVIPETDCNGS